MTNPKASAGGSGRFALVYVAPALLLMAAAVAPLVAGARTLYLRDVLSVHYEMKWAQAEALAEGHLPLVDEWRSGGQPLLGNLNAAPLYPDGLLLLAASPLWALNAHFWLHLLLAPWTGYWMGRAWGLGREGSWAAGVCFAASGYFLSNLNLFNLVAGVAWAPALVAACLDLAAGRRPRASFLAVGLIWTLLILAGDPMTALAALALALAALASRRGASWSAWGRPAAALALGTLAAAPQIVELVRILPASFRGVWGYSEAGATAASWHPATAVEWLVPFAFGAPGLAFWGAELYPGGAPLYFSLFPGALTLVLVAAAGLPRRRASRWAWGAVAVGLFLALGRFNPAVGWLLEATGGGLLRLPVKLWLLVAVGGALLCGLGYERLLDGRGRRAAGWTLGGLGVAYLAMWLALAPAAGPGRGALRRWIPESWSGGFVDGERLRWAGLCLLSLLLVALYAAIFKLARRRRAALAALLVLHVGSQLLLLRPLHAGDAAGPYLRPPPALDRVPEGARLVQGDAAGLFGRHTVDAADFPDPRLLWLARETWSALFPPAAVHWRRLPELAGSPEGLDAFLTRAAIQALPRLDDAGRLRLLAVWGVEYLLLQRRLDPAVGAERLAELPMRGPRLRVYRLLEPAPEVLFAGVIHPAPHLNAALGRLLDPGFDPRREAVAAGGGPPRRSEGGRARVVGRGRERLEVEVDAAGPGMLVVQSTPLPILRAEVDGRRVPIVAANLHRLGVELPAGRHRVVIRTDRRPLHLSLALAAAALTVLATLATRLRRRSSESRPRPPAQSPEPPETAT